MKVIFCSYNDYSNFAYSLSESLKSVGINSKSLALTPHPFNYEKTSLVVNHITMIDEMKEADIIIIAHSSEHILSLCKDFGKRLFVIHTGTPYRQEPERMNSIFNPVCERILFDSPEFDSLIQKEERNYIAGAIDTDKIKFSDYHNSVLTFAHYPNKPETKGTAKIIEMMKEFQVKFIYDTTDVNHEHNLKRISECDVYIELFAPKQKDKVYGSFGVTAFEAAAMGKIVITNSMYHNVYRANYGSCELSVANDEEFFKAWIKYYQNTSLEKIKEYKILNRNWIVENHSYNATGKYLIKVLNLQS